MFPHSVTIYREITDGYERYFLDGVLWEDRQGEAVEKSGLADANSLTLYIPLSVGFRPQKGDFALKGKVEYEVKAKASELYALGDVRVIRSVDVFDYGGLQHYKAGGK